MVDGVPITGSSSPMAIQSGALAGSPICATSSRRSTARNSTRSPMPHQRFAESDQTGGTAPTLPGLFTFPAPPRALDCGDTGLASEIEVNANVDPSQGATSISCATAHRRSDQFSLHL